MNTRLIQLNKTQNEIEDFFESIKNTFFTGRILRKEIVKAVVHFLDIKLDPTIVNLFISSTEFSRDKEGNANHGIFDFSVLGRGYTLKKIGINGDLNPKIVPLEIALKASRMMIDKFNEEERLISFSLMKSLTDDKFQILKSSLESIENKYQKKEWTGMMSPLVQATDQVLNLIPDDNLQKEKGLNEKLQKIFTTKELYIKYVAGNKDIIWALNNSRVIRNTIEHKKSEYGEVSLLRIEVIGYVHLLILLINTLFASGEIKFEKIDE